MSGRCQRAYVRNSSSVPGSILLLAPHPRIAGYRGQAPV
jgi:hypothetical protein